MLEPYSAACLASVSNASLPRVSMTGLATGRSRQPFSLLHNRRGLPPDVCSRIARGSQLPCVTMNVCCFTDAGETWECLIMYRVLEFLCNQVSSVKIIIFVRACYKHLRIQNVLMQDFMQMRGTFGRKWPMGNESIQRQSTLHLQ